MSRVAGSVAVAALWACVSSCGVVLGYPPVVAESDAAHCANGVDDDLDGETDCHDADCVAFCGENTLARCSNHLDDDMSGAADCDDPHCDGFCPEETPAACADGRDQDADGLVDLADPSCWPAATTTVTRCTSQPGDAWEATFDGVDDGWLSRGAPATYAPDPLGMFSRSVLALPAASTPGVPAYVTNARLVTGGIVGLDLRVSVLVDDAIALDLLSPTAPPPRAPSEIFVLLGRGNVQTSLVVDGRELTAFGTGATDSGWKDVHVTIDGAVMHVAVTGFAPVDVPYTGTLSSGAAMQLAVGRLSAVTPGSLLGAATVTRPAVEPCGTAVPSVAHGQRSIGVPLAAASSATCSA